MRVSTQIFYEQSKSAMGSLQSNLLRTQQQLGAGTKILAPSDDPLGATRALAVSQSIALNAQYAASRAHTTQSLSMEENALHSVTDVLQDVKTQLIQAGGTMSDADRATIATTLQSSLDQLQGLANTDDGNGQFLFAGFKSGTPPFVRQADGSISYVGDQGQRLTQVDVSRQMASTDDGQRIFQHDGTDVFATLNTVIAALKTPVNNAGAQALMVSALGTANREITTAHDNVLTVRSSVGSRLKELDALGVTGDNRTLSDKSYLSDLQDLDYGSTIAEFYQRQTALQASQQTFVKIQQIALFNYL
ncbi:MAG: flagellar hook-associated protein FlgL [Polaromonas sp.]